MRLSESFRAVKPRQHLAAFEACGLVRQVRVIRRIRPVAEIADEAVLLRVLVNISDQANEASVGGDEDAAKGTLE